MFQTQGGGLEGDAQDVVAVPVRFWSIVLAVVIVVGALYAGYYFSLDDTDKIMRNKLLNGYASRESGDFESSNSYFTYVAETTNDPQIRAKAELALASNNGREIDDIQSRQIAIQKLKVIASDPNVSDPFRADAINRMGSLYYYGRDPVIAKEIFSTEPYSSFLNEASGDISLAMRKLEEYSDDIDPTSMAELRIATWYSFALMDKELTKQEKTDYAEKVISLVESSYKLFDAELKRGRHTTNTDKALFWHRRALNLGAIAVAGMSKTPGEFEKSFEEVYKLDNPAIGDSGRLMHEFTAYSHYYQAAFLYKIFGTSRIDDVRMHAQKIIDVFSSSPEPNLVAFTVLMNTERDKPETKRDHGYDFFVSIASASPEFARFLSDHGWQLN